VAAGAGSEFEDGVHGRRIVTGRGERDWSGAKRFQRPVRVSVVWWE
jgi:hypothetical protein